MKKCASNKQAPDLKCHFLIDKVWQFQFQVYNLDLDNSDKLSENQATIIFIMCWIYQVLSICWLKKI